jgi:hypothetical protein
VVVYKQSLSSVILGKILGEIGEKCDISQGGHRDIALD